MFESQIATLASIVSDLGFYVPIGIIGIWRWGVWLFKETVALFYEPYRADYNADVTVVTPVYNEDPDTFWRALHSWKSNGVHTIVAVIDESDKKSIELFNAFSVDFPNSKLIVTDVPGKRPALATGIRATTTEIVALVDSDTLWTDSVLANSLSAFSDPKVAGVATRQNILKTDYFAQKIFDIQLDLRYFDEMPFMAAGGDALICLSGRTAFYRHSVVLPMVEDLENETFLGNKVVSGDDKRLTHLVQAAGWKTAYQQNALVYTPAEEDLGTYMKQRLRWTRNSLRADTRALFDGWVWKHPALAFFMVDKIIQSFTMLLSPIYFLIAVSRADWIAAVVLVGWWFVSRSIKLYPHLRRKPEDIVILPAYVLFTFFGALIKVYAIFTLNTSAWITRWDASRLKQLGWLDRAPAYLSTALVIVLLAGIVNISSPIEMTLADGGSLPLVSSHGNILGFNQVFAQSKDTVGANELAGATLRRYVVKSGDTFSSIARNHGISQQTLLEVNANVVPAPNILLPGLILNIPSNELTYVPVGKTTSKSSIPPVTIRYDEPSDTIQVAGRGNQVTLSQIHSIVGDDVLQKLDGKQWYLKANLDIQVGVTLHLTDKDVSWLKLESNQDDEVWVRTYSGVINIENTKITSWDVYENDYDHDYSDGRSFVVAKLNARMDILNSELSYLGFPPPPVDVSSPYGVAWKIPNDSYGKYLVTGDVRNSKFHHNYFGAYTYGATGMIWIGNEFYENTVYGLDPHDYSNSFFVDSNVAHHNGKHGIIFSIGCFNNVIANNHSFGNGGHGIMLHKDTNFNTVRGNTVYGNVDGIVLYESSNNLISSNEAFANDKGFRANHHAENNLVELNKFNHNHLYGVYLYADANHNMLDSNSVIGNSEAGLYIKTEGNSIVDNVVTYDDESAWYVVSEESTAQRNYIDGNVVNRLVE